MTGRRRWSVLVAICVTAAVAAPVDEAPAVGQTPTGRSISGTIRGVDGRFVNAQISLVLRTANGTFIGMDGQPIPASQYAAWISMNREAPVEGLATGGVASWSFDDVPPNAARFTMEIYPRGPDSPRGNWTHYGGASKRRVEIPASGLANVRLRLPINCNIPGGTTGSIRVRRFHNGQPAGGLSRFLALSESNPPSGIQGFRFLREIPEGESRPEIDGVAPDQRYSVNIYTATQKFAFYEVPVRPCARTDLIAYSGTGRPVPPRFSRLRVSAGGSRRPVPGDFNGDGNDDIFFYGPGREGDELWLSRGDGRRFLRLPRTIAGAYRPVPGDFNADGIDDIFFYGPAGRADRLWRFRRGGTHRVFAAQVGGTRSTRPVGGDFDGNGYDDILFATPGRSSRLQLHTAGAARQRRVTVPSARNLAAGDIDGDLRDDIVWHNGSTGTVKLWFGRRDATFLRRSHVIRPGPFVPIMADVSGDLRDDVIWYGPRSRPDLLWRGRSQTFPYFSEEIGALGIGGHYSPVAGDWNGDHAADVLWYGRRSIHDLIWRSNPVAWRPQVRTQREASTAPAPADPEARRPR